MIMKIDSSVKDDEGEEPSNVVGSIPKAADA